PCECRTLAPAVKRRFAPGIEQIKTLLGLTGRARVLAVHIEAGRTAVDLRGAHLDELEQAALEAGAIDVRLQCEHRLRRARNHSEKVETRFHLLPLSLKDHAMQDEQGRSAVTVLVLSMWESHGLKFFRIQDGIDVEDPRAIGAHRENGDDVSFE